MTFVDGSRLNGQPFNPDKFRADAALNKIRQDAAERRDALRKSQLDSLKAIPWCPIDPENVKGKTIHGIFKNGPYVVIVFDDKSFTAFVSKKDQYDDWYEIHLADTELSDRLDWSLIWALQAADVLTEEHLNLLRNVNSCVNQVERQDMEYQQYLELKAKYEGFDLAQAGCCPAQSGGNASAAV